MGKVINKSGIKGLVEISTIKRQCSLRCWRILSIIGGLQGKACLFCLLRHMGGQLLCFGIGIYHTRSQQNQKNPLVLA